MSFIAVGASAAVTIGTTIYATQAQAKAAKDAAKIQATAAGDATQAQLQQYYQTREDLGPYRAAGEQALGQLTQGIDQRAQVPGSSPYPQPPHLTPFSGQVDLAQDPGYQFRVSEGLRAIEHSAASKGQLQSGNTLKALTRFGQDQASQEYGAAYQRGLVTNQAQNLVAQQDFQNAGVTNATDYARQQGAEATRFNRYATLAGFGAGANAQQVQATSVLGGQIGENILGAGNAQAAGQIGAANAFSQGLAGAAQTLNSGANNYLTLKQLGLLGGK